MENKQVALQEKLTAIAIKIRLPGKEEPQSVKLLINDAHELVGIADAELLQAWLNSGRNSVRRISHVSPQTQRDAKFFGEEPCWFEGCEELRRAYDEDVRKITEAKGNCTGCDRGSLNRKYLKLVAQAQAQ